MKSCLICDDHAIMREALVGVVALAWPAAEIAEAADFPSAWAAAAAQPGLIVCDLIMPGAAPLDGVRGLTAAAPDTPILVVTGNDDDALLLDLFNLGVAGFAPKTSRSLVIQAAIRLILAGGRYLPPRLGELAAQQSNHPAAPVGVAARLTERQIDVLRLIGTGQTNKAIARALDLSPATIKTHAAAALAALGASNRTEAVLRAREMGLI